jgi:N-acetylneuraminic acid mutarotase
MVVFGGRFREGGSGAYTHYDDVWTFDLATDTWAQVVTNIGPTARVNATLVYDAERDRFVLFGGNTSTNGLAFAPEDETWALDAASGDWTQIAESSEPDPRQFHAAAVTPDGTRMIVMAGGDEQAFQGPFLVDVWELDLATDTWNELDPIEADAFISAGLGSGGDGLLLFGGHDDGALGNRNDLWLIDPSADPLAWELSVPGDEIDQGGGGFCDFPVDFATVNLEIPERRSAFGFAVAADGAAYVFGGKTDCGITNDVWSWDPGTGAWSERFPSSGGGGLSCLRTGRQDCSSHCF